MDEVFFFFSMRRDFEQIAFQPAQAQLYGYSDLLNQMLETGLQYNEKATRDKLPELCEKIDAYAEKERKAESEFWKQGTLLPHMNLGDEYKKVKLLLDEMNAPIFAARKALAQSLQPQKHLKKPQFALAA